MLGVRLALHAAAGVVTAAILAPLVAPGYVLRYDMNFVPVQPLRGDLIAPADIAPRAVPLDAAVSLANTIMPGWLLQRVVLVAIIWAAVVGAGRLVPSDETAVRIIAGIGYGWTAFLAERLLLGQWGLLIAYAALPWLVMAALKLRSGDRGAWLPLILTAGLSALTPTGGLIAAVVCLALLPWRRWLAASAALLVLNAPWLLAAVLSNADTRSDPAGVAAFAARSENWGGAVVALLGTGGIWNAETTPASRSSPVVPVLTLGLLLLAFIGYRIEKRLIVVALGGLGLAAVSTFPAGLAAMQWLVSSVPGAGLLRDGHKFVLPYALVLAVCVAMGAQRLAKKLPREPGRVLLIGIPVLLIGALPDLAWGAGGALKPVRYPADWDAVAALVERQPGPMVSLPLSQYRRYEWNHGTIVLDPAPRYFDVPVLIDDRLVVGEEVIEGESRRLREIRDLLTRDEPVARSGVAWVLVQNHGSLPGRALDGLQPAFAGEHLALYRNPDASPSGLDGEPRIAVIAGEIAAFAMLVVAAVLTAHRARRRWRSSPRGDSVPGIRHR